MQDHSREPAVAGMFYDFDREGLTETISNLMSGIKKCPEYGAVVSPHAGYAYSGRTAARAISSLKPSRRFIILGPNHTGLGPNFSIMSSGTWKTPLGPAAIDKEIAGELLSSGITEEDLLAHSREHSIEVQLPFLQHSFGKVSFVPVTIMGFGYTKALLDKCTELGKHIAKVSRKHDARIIASSDFSHYISRDAAREKDLAAIDMIKDLDAEGFFRVLHETRASICGYAPIAVLISAAKSLGLKRAELLEYTTSGDVTGDTSQVVAYSAIGFR